MKQVTNFAEQPSIISQYLAFMRDKNQQDNRLLFRHYMHRTGALMAYEISRTLTYEKRETETPLGVATTQHLQDSVVLAPILRAGLALHEGVLDIFDSAQTTFIGSYRKPTIDEKTGSPDIAVDYLVAPTLTDTVLIACDPMLATGSSMVTCLDMLLKNQGTPKMIHILCLLATPASIAKVHARYPHAHIWCAAVDPVLNSHNYIIPGLGDAGDLAYGKKD